MVIHLSQIETLVLIPTSPRTILNGVPAVQPVNVLPSNNVYSVFVPSNPKHNGMPSWNFANKLRQDLFCCFEGNSISTTELLYIFQVLWVLTVHVTCTEVELRTTGLCMLTTTSPNSFCTRRWSTPCAVGLMSRRKDEGHLESNSCAYNLESIKIHTYFCTLCPDRLRHGAGVPEPLSIDCPYDEQVDSIRS